MKQKISQSVTYWLGVVVIGLVVGLSIQFVRAWVAPSAAPPGVNVGAPINTGANSQTKNGWLGVVKDLIVGGNVGIGTTTPAARLEVAGTAAGGTIRIGNSGEPCDGAHDGLIAANRGGGGLWFCNGVAWERISAGGGGGSCYWGPDTNNYTCNAGYYVAGVDCTGSCGGTTQSILCCKL